MPRLTRQLHRRERVAFRCIRAEIWEALSPAHVPEGTGSGSIESKTRLAVAIPMVGCPVSLLCTLLQIRQATLVYHIDRGSRSRVHVNQQRPSQPTSQPVQGSNSFLGFTSLPATSDLCRAVDPRPRPKSRRTDLGGKIEISENFHRAESEADGKLAYAARVETVHLAGRPAG